MCGQFDANNNLDGYGFAIYRDGTVEQGIFDNGILSKCYEHVTFDQKQQYSCNSMKNGALSGYCIGPDEDGIMIEGYVKTSLVSGENLMIVGSKNCFVSMKTGRVVDY